MSILTSLIFIASAELMNGTAANLCDEMKDKTPFANSVFKI